MHDSLRLPNTRSLKIHSKKILSCPKQIGSKADLHPHIHFVIARSNSLWWVLQHQHVQSPISVVLSPSPHKFPVPVHDVLTWCSCSLSSSCSTLQLDLTCSGRTWLSTSCSHFLSPSRSASRSVRTNVKRYRHNWTALPMVEHCVHLAARKLAAHSRHLQFRRIVVYTRLQCDWVQCHLSKTRRILFQLDWHLQERILSTTAYLR